MYRANCQENFSRVERRRDIFDFTATHKVTAKTEKKMKTLVKKEQRRLFSFKRICLLYSINKLF
jgi:hypothetical protein